jgi:hypothetical protein
MGLRWIMWATYIDYRHELPLGLDVHFFELLYRVVEDFSLRLETVTDELHTVLGRSCQLSPPVDSSTSATSDSPAALPTFKALL